MAAPCAAKISGNTHILSRVKTWLFDCDGVLWNGAEIIPGAKDLISTLKKQGKRVFFVTNNSSKTQKQYLERFTNLGLDVKAEEIACTSYVAAQYLKQQGFTDKVYLIGGEALGTELDNCGIPHCGIGPDPLAGGLEDWKKMEFDPEVKCVVVGYDRHISYMKVMRAASYIRNRGCQFIATNEDSFLPLPGTGITVPGTGSIVAPVRVASGKDPIYMGKPHAPIFDTLKRAHSLNPEETIMVGDRLNTDIELARRCGLASALVLTGVTSAQEASELSDADRPTVVAPSVKELLDCL